MRWSHRHVLLSFLFLGGFYCGGTVWAVERDQPFRIGFSQRLFSTVNGTDAKASVKAWAVCVAQERNIHMDPVAQLFDQVEQMADAMLREQVDCVSVVFDEYLDLVQRVELDRCFVTRTDGSFLEEYILLVSSKSGINQLSDLKGCTLSIHNSARTSLAPYWLDFLILQQKGSPGTREYFGLVKPSINVSGAVLPVFFGQADVALVAESSYLMMCELNPQLQRALRVLLRSSPLVPAVMCFRKSYTSDEEEQLLTALRELHTTPAGEQVLTIFKAEALLEVDEQPVQETIDFCAAVDDLRRGRGKVFRIGGSCE